MMTEKQSILIISDAWLPQINGVVRTYEHLIAELQQLGHTVNIIGPTDFKMRTAMPGYKEIDVVLFPYPALKKKIRQINPTAIHIATEGPMGKAARRYCIRHKIPFVTAYHTQFPAYVAKRVAKTLPFLENLTFQIVDFNMRRFHAAAASMMITTNSLKEELIARGYKTKMHVSPHAVSMARFSPAPSDALSDIKGPIALYVGRIAIEKNLRHFLAMKWEGTKVLVGSGPSIKEFKKKYPDAVFLGPKTGDDLTAIYRAADIFVFPSRTDTFGIVLLEALACGLPIAAHNVVGPKDIVTSPLLGALHDDLEIAATRALNADGNARQRFEHVKKNYSWKQKAKNFVKMLEEDCAA